MVESGDIRSISPNPEEEEQQEEADDDSDAEGERICSRAEVPRIGKKSLKGFEISEFWKNSRSTQSSIRLPGSMASMIEKLFGNPEIN
jgi:hypothetical protein